MFEPKQHEVEAAETELLLNKIADTNMLHEAIGNDDGDLINVLQEFARADSIDEKLACHDKYMSALKKYFHLEGEARDFIIGQVGYTVRTAVDNYKFVPHNTRD